MKRDYYGKSKARLSGRYKKARKGRKSRMLNRRDVASQETGFVDVGGPAMNFDTTGSITHLNPVSQGPAVTQRIGKKIRLKSLQGRGWVFPGSTAIVNDIALLIVYDKRPTGVLPAITAILDTASSNSMNNDANSGRFKILYRKDMILTGNPAAIANVDTTTIQSTDFFLDLKGIPTTYKALGTGVIGDVDYGALYLVTVGSNVAGTTAASGNMSFRVRFIDV